MAGTRRRVVLVGGLMIVLAACSSGAKGASSTSTSPTSVVRVSSTAAPLSFREVLATNACAGSPPVTPVARQAAGARVVLSDPQKKTCYTLGPILLMTRNIDRADAAVDPTSSAWVVNVHFTNNDFVTNVAGPEVGRQVAIILDGVVQSAPRINDGITGQDVTISGVWDEPTARAIAARIDPSSASRVPETPTTTAADKERDALSRRCTAVAPRLGFSPETSISSTITAANARSALQRGHEPVPVALSAIAADERLALCYLTSAPFPDPTSPTTVCPNGDPAEIGSAPETMYAVDAHLNTFKLPGLQYLIPPGMTVPTTPGPSAGLGG